MKLMTSKSKNKTFYYVTESFRKGNKVSSRIVFKIGEHNELLSQGIDDPKAYALNEVKKLNEEIKENKLTVSENIDFSETLDRTVINDISKELTKNIGYIYLDNLMDSLDIDKFAKSIKTKARFDISTILRYLSFDRVINPRSKLKSYEGRHEYYGNFDFSLPDVYRCLTLIGDNDKSLQKHLFEGTKKIIDINDKVLYYDCTNFYCECEQQDEDVIDEVTGETIKGLRQYGVSKEHRPNPFVEMGLFMDSRGIPITMCLHPGNTSEQLTAIPLEKEVLKMIPGAKFIYCADAGLGSYNIRKFNSMGGRAFIVTQSVKKLSTTLKEAVFNDYDYRLLSDNSKVSIEELKTFDKHAPENRELYNDSAYKVIVADKALDLGLYEDKVLKNGKTIQVKSKGMLKQRIIITFSRKMMEYQRTIRNRQIDRAKKLLNLNDPEELKKGPNDVRRFMKRVSKTKSGEKATIEYILDEARIKEEEKYDGYYAVATNLEDPAKDILAVSHKRYQIEDCFRVMKTNLDGRPINHRLPERIRAHFLICYTGLLVYRLLEARLDDHETHVTVKNLVTTLKNINVTCIHDVEYMALYNGSKALDALVSLTTLNLDRMHYKPKELNRMIKKLLK